MYGSGYVFSKSFFTGWVVVGIMWLFFSSFCVGLFPLWQGRKTAVHTVKSMFLDATGKRPRTTSTPTDGVVGDADSHSGDEPTSLEKVSEIADKK
jgi:urea-proton symporter